MELSKLNQAFREHPIFVRVGGHRKCSHELERARVVKIEWKRGVDERFRIHVTLADLKLNVHYTLVQRGCIFEQEHENDGKHGATSTSLPLRIEGIDFSTIDVYR